MRASSAARGMVRRFALMSARYPRRLMNWIVSLYVMNPLNTSATVIHRRPYTEERNAFFPPVPLSRRHRRPRPGAGSFEHLRRSSASPSADQSAALRHTAIARGRLPPESLHVVTHFVRG